MKLSINDIKYIIQETKERILLTEISNNAIETLFKKYCTQGTIQCFELTIEELYEKHPGYFKRLRVTDEVRINYPNMKVKDYMRIRLMKEFEINRGRGPIKYFRGIIRICCDEIYYFDDYFFNRNLLTKFRQIINYLMLNENPFNEDLNGLSFQQLDKAVGSEMRISAYREMLKREKEENEDIQTTFGEYTVVPITCYKDATKYRMYTSWCVTSMSDQYNTYTSDDSAFFFCLRNGFENVKKQRGENCPLDEYGLSMVSVLVYPDGNPKLVTTRWNHDYGGENNPDLKTLEQVEQVLGIPKKAFKVKSMSALELEDIEVFLAQGGDIEDITKIIFEGNNGLKFFKFKGKYNACQGGRLLSQWYSNYDMQDLDDTKVVICFSGNSVNAFDADGKVFPEDLKGSYLRCISKNIYSMGYGYGDTIKLYHKGSIIPLLDDINLRYIPQFSGGIAMIVNDENKMNFIDDDGRIIWDHFLPLSGTYWSEGILITRNPKRLFDIKKQQYINDDEYTYADIFKNGVSIVRKDRSDYNLVKRDGTYVFNNFFDNIVSVSGHEDQNKFFACLKEDKGWIISDKDGNFIKEDVYWDDVTSFTGVYGTVRLHSGKYAFIDSKCNILWESDDRLEGVFGNKTIFATKESNIYRYYAKSVRNEDLTSLLIYEGSSDGGMFFEDEKTGKKIFLNTKTGDLVTVVNESRNRGILSEINVRDAYQRFYKNIPLDTYNQIVSYIQDNNNVLLADTKWVLKCYAKNPQDTMRLVPLLHNENGGYLDIYNRLKAIHRIEESDRDITKFSNLRDFTNFVQKKMNELGDEEIWGDNTHRKKVNMNDKQKSAKNDIKKFYEDDEWLVISPNSYEASCYWGSDTEWCTAFLDDRSYYDRYSRQGRIYINIDKTTKEKFQFHFESNQFMDAYDSNIHQPILYNIGASDGLVNFYKNLVNDMYFIKLAYELNNEISLQHTYFNVYSSDKGYTIIDEDAETVFCENVDDYKTIGDSFVKVFKDKKVGFFSDYYSSPLKNEWFDDVILIRQDVQQDYRTVADALIALKVNKHYFISNIYGNTTCDEDIDRIDFDFDYHMCGNKVYNNGKVNYLDADGNLMFKEWVDNILDEYYDSKSLGKLVVVEMDNKYNLFGDGGEPVSDIWFDEISFIGKYITVMFEGDVYQFLIEDGLIYNRRTKEEIYVRDY